MSSYYSLQFCAEWEADALTAAEMTAIEYLVGVRKDRRPAQFECR